MIAHLERHRENIVPADAADDFSAPRSEHCTGFGGDFTDLEVVDGAVRPSAAGGEDGIEIHGAERPATQYAKATVKVLANEGRVGLLVLANAATGDGYRISFQNGESGYWLVGLRKSAGGITTEYGWISVAWGAIAEGDVIEVPATGALGRTPTPPYVSMSIEKCGISNVPGNLVVRAGSIAAPE